MAIAPNQSRSVARRIQRLIQRCAMVHSVARGSAIAVGLLVFVPVFPILVPTVRAQSVPGSPFSRPVLQAGSRGIEVAEVQAALVLLGFYDGAVDGIYGESTAAAVTQFQQMAGLPADGVVGASTWDRLLPPDPLGCTCLDAVASTRPQRPEGAIDPVSLENLPTLRVGVQAPQVVVLQVRLQALGFYKGVASGIFGEETERAVLAAQEFYRLAPDGVVGPATWEVLLR